MGVALMYGVWLVRSLCALFVWVLRRGALAEAARVYGICSVFARLLLRSPIRRLAEFESPRGRVFCCVALLVYGS